MSHRSSSRQSSYARLLLCAALCTAFHAGATEEPGNRSGSQNTGPPVVVVLLSDPGITEAVPGITGVLQAHLNNLPASLQTVEIEEVPERRAGQVALARSFSSNRGASLVLWFLDKGARMAVFTPEFGDPSLNAIRLKATPGSSLWKEAVGVVVHSEISALLPASALAAPAADDPPDEGSGGSPSTGTLPAPLVSNTEAPPLSRAPGPVPLSIGALVGYAPTWPMVEGSMQHGLRLGLSLGVTKYAAIEIQGDIARPLPVHVGTDDATLWRWPLRLQARGYVPLWDFRLGAGIGAVLEPSYLRGLAEQPAHGPSAETRVAVGAVVSVALQYWALDWLGLNLDGGADLFRNAVRYTLDDEVLLEVNRTRYALSVGAAVRFSVQGE